MKTNLFKYALSVGLVLFLLACSTKKNSFVRRNYHAVTAEYNILYNGGVAFDKGVEELKGTYKDNFWEILPVERMQDIDAGTLPGQTKNANFERAETKAIKAIQKHSMYIEGGEKNPQMDEAHLLLGKARYYDNRFIPALEAFNYILYKYSNSDKIYEAKVWREKTNIRLENEVLAIKNLKKLLEDQKIKGQVQADANAILGQAYMNLGSIDSALVNLKVAKDLTRHNEEKARYHFIIGQLYESMNYPDSAYASFQSVIDMNRKSPRRYVIQAHAKQAQQFDSKKGDTLAFLKKFNKLAEDRENRPYLDVINHQVALFYDKQGNKRQ
ncbi:MAG: gliding motility protein, partial [Flavobacterium sp.]|nr:gliding motility protein [Flavobacterium sp.]